MWGRKMFWKILIRILRCSKKDYAKAVRSGRDTYIITLSKFVPAQEELRKWAETFYTARKER